MKEQLTFLLSLLLIVLTAWSIATFHKLIKASKKYPSSEAFEAVCGLSFTYVKVGFWTSIAVLLISVGLFGLSAFRLSRSPKRKYKR